MRFPKLLQPATHHGLMIILTNQLRTIPFCLSCDVPWLFPLYIPGWFQLDAKIIDPKDVCYHTPKVAGHLCKNCLRSSPKTARFVGPLAHFAPFGTFWLVPLYIYIYIIFFFWGPSSHDISYIIIYISFSESLDSWHCGNGLPRNHVT